MTGNAVRGTRRGSADANYIVLSEDASNVVYGTYLGGTSQSYIEPISSIQVIENNGNFAGTYINFVDNASDVPTTANAFQPNHGGATDLVVAKLSSSFSLEWMTYLGGSGPEFMETHGLAIDAAGRPITAAVTASSNFPTTSGAYDRTFDGASDAFISILSADGQSLFASSLLGGSGDDSFEGVDVLSDGTIVVSGTTASNGMPVSSGAFQTFLGGGEDGLFARWSADLSNVLEFTYIGGSANDRTGDVSTSSTDQVGLAGIARSSPFPTVNSNDSNVNGSSAAIYGLMEPD